jgi:hypothetical protein
LPGRFLVQNVFIPATMKISKPVRKRIGWLVALGAVAGMVLGNFTASTPLVGVVSDLGAMTMLGLGMVLIVA